MEIKEEEKKEGTEKKITIVIKLPFDLQERLLSFPFLHALSEHYPKAELHFITPRKDIEVLNLLPFKAYYHEYDEDDFKTVFDVHRYAVNAKIMGEVDIFFSLTNSFVDATLGLAFKAKERIGFADNWKTLVLNKKTLRPTGHHLCEDYFTLWKLHLGGEVDTKKIKVMSRDLPPVVADWDTLPYIAVNLAPTKGAWISNDWLEFVSQFENKRFVFFASEEQDKVQLLMDSFLASLPKNNFYEPFLLKNWIDIAKMMAFARGVVTYNGPAASVAAYTGSKTIILNDREDPQRFGPFYFLADIMLISPEALKEEGTLRPPQTFDMGHVVDRACDFFKL